jgi:glycyl-tRNA synthetase beta chain
LKDFVSRVESLTNIIEKDYFENLNEAAGRIIRIIKGKEIQEMPKAEFFKEECEKDLYISILAVDENENIEKLAEELALQTDKISKFFEKVLVMDKDENVKNNRLKLLTLVKSKFEKICDFSQLSV